MVRVRRLVDIEVIAVEPEATVEILAHGVRGDAGEVLVVDVSIEGPGDRLEQDDFRNAGEEVLRPRRRRLVPLHRRGAVRVGIDGRRRRLVRDEGDVGKPAREFHFGRPAGVLRAQRSRERERDQKGGDSTKFFHAVP